MRSSPSLLLISCLALFAFPGSPASAQDTSTTATKQAEEGIRMLSMPRSRCSVRLVNRRRVRSVAGIQRVIFRFAQPNASTRKSLRLICRRGTRTRILVHCPGNASKRVVGLDSSVRVRGCPQPRVTVVRAVAAGKTGETPPEPQPPETNPPDDNADDGDDDDAAGDDEDSDGEDSDADQDDGGPNDDGGTDDGDDDDANSGGGDDSEDEGDSDNNDEDVLFPWVDDGGFDDNWAEGLGIFALGFLGALVTAYLFLGGFLPSMGGKAEYDALGIDIENLERRRDKVLEFREKFTRGELEAPDPRVAAADRLTEHLAAAINAKEQARSDLRRRLTRIGMPMYLVLGGGFAVLFATNLLQAILIGFGWTAVADRIGLRQVTEAKAEKREAEITTLEERAQKVAETEKELAKARDEARVLRDLVAKLVAPDTPASGGEGA